MFGADRIEQVSRQVVRPLLQRRIKLPTYHPVTRRHCRRVFTQLGQRRICGGKPIRSDIAESMQHRQRRQMHMRLYKSWQHRFALQVDTLQMLLFIQQTFGLLGCHAHPGDFPIFYIQGVCVGRSRIHRHDSSILDQQRLCHFRELCSRHLPGMQAEIYVR